LFSAETRKESQIVKPVEGDWAFTCGSFSPDGRFFLQDLTEVRGPSRNGAGAIDIAADILQTVGPGGERRPKWSRLAIIDTESGRAALADGRFDDFATAPVWSADSEWAAFTTPFDAHRLWTCRVTSPRPALEMTEFATSVPTPIANVTDFLPS